MLERVWWKREPSYTVGGMQIDAATMKNSMDIPLKTRHKTPYDPAIPLLGIEPEETIVEKDTCTPMFIAALFTVAGTWKQPRCPPTDEWIKKLWYIYNGILLSYEKEHM